ncbi:MAG: carboxymuconolactone decarboxylase family protein [Porticoccaceae bacterium]
MSDNDEKLARGLDLVNEVYADPALTTQMAGLADQPYTSETIRHLFADIWGRPGLSIRDRRLLVIGATTMLGRADLLEVQLRGGILNGEFTDEELDEMVLHMAFYAGWGNTTALNRAVGEARRTSAEMNKNR